MTADTSYDWVRSRLRELSAGALSTADKERLEQIALSDPFVADALEGYTAVPSADHATNLDQLHRRITQPKRARRRWLMPNLTVTAIAAVFMILVGTWAVVRWSGQRTEESRLVILSPDGMGLPARDSADAPSLAAGMGTDTTQASPPEEATIASVTRDIEPTILSPATPANKAKKSEPTGTGLAIPESPSETARRTLTAPTDESAVPFRTFSFYAFVEKPDTKERIRDGIRIFLLPTSLQYRPDEKGVVMADVPTPDIARHLLVRYAELGDRTYTAYDGNSMWPFAYPPPEEDPRKGIPDYALPAIQYADFIDRLYRESRLTFEKDLKKSAHAITVSFTVGKDGRLRDLATTPTSAPKVHIEEAIRLLQTGPDWMCPGNKVPCQGTFTFFFKEEAMD